MKLPIVAIFALTLLAACTSNKGNYRTTAEVEERLRGMSETELAAKLGAPNETVTLSNGSISWSYRNTAGGLTGGTCTINVILKDAVVSSASVNADDRSFVSFPLGSCKNLLGSLD